MFDMFFLYNYNVHYSMSLFERLLVTGNCDEKNVLINVLYIYSYILVRVINKTTCGEKQ